MPDITVTNNGPYMLSAEGVVLKTQDGRTIAGQDGADIFLCRCGHSASKPFCDGSHTREGFKDDPAGE